MAQERSIEVKVGVLILVAMVILGGFILVMGGLSFEKTFPLYVDFDNPGGLQTGAPVKMAGIKVGSISEIKFQGKIDPDTGRRTLVRVKANVEAKYRDAIHYNPGDYKKPKEDHNPGDADFYVTAQGVLGEQFLAINPGDPALPMIEEESVVQGVDPPRLDLFLAKAYDLLDVTVSGIKNNKKLLGEILDDTGGLLKGLNVIVHENKDRITHIIENFETVSQEVVTLTRDVDKNYVNNPSIQRTINNIDQLTAQLKQDSGPVLHDAKEALANLKTISGTFGDQKELDKVRATLTDVQKLAEKANKVSDDAGAIVAHIKAGKGTVGAVVMDEEIYDDLQEMVRDLKHNPWKFLWRE